MKINNLGAASPQPIIEHEVSGRVEKNVGFFAADLRQAEDGQSKDRLNSLLDQITKQGKRLGQVPTYSELKTYRELVRRFVGEAVGRMYSLHSNAGWDRHGRQKMYTIIRQIDEKLAGLTEDVRQGQERQLEIMAKQDAIRGMLVDLYM
ncbi:MAG: YaaR family protein [Negativicutes bacterium]